MLPAMTTANHIHLPFNPVLLNIGSPLEPNPQMILLRLTFLKI